MEKSDLKTLLIHDPAISRKAGIVSARFKRDKNSLPLPSVVEISESGTCNRTCVFCPRSDPNYPDVKEFIDPALFRKLVDQLAEVGFDGMILFSGFVEPLLDKNLSKLIAMAREKLPTISLEIVTNGDVLDEKRLRQLFESGLSTILISVYDGPEDVKRFEQLCGEAGLDEKQYVIRHRYLPAEKNFGIALTNRSGMLEGAEFKVSALEEPLANPCYYPSYTFFMDYKGDVLLCPHDWGKKLIIGNMKELDFLDIWLSDVALNARRSLNEANRNFAPCNVCDVNGTFMGQGHAEVWAAHGSYDLAGVDD